MQKLIQHKFGWLILIVAFAAINLLASVFHTRFDLTKEKRYTISKTTKTILRKLDDKMEVQVFLKGDLPSGFQKLANTTADFLQLLKENNSPKITYKFIDASDEMDDAQRTYADTLVSLGATPINLTVQIKQGQQTKMVFPYALVKYKGQETLVNLYSGGKRYISATEMNSAEAMMEYKFAKTINSLVNPEKPLVAYSVGNGEPANATTYNLQQVLRKDYTLFTFDINKQPIPDTFKVLMIAKPSIQFTEEEKLKIDQYLLRGGNVLCFIDNLNAEQDSLRIKPELVAYDRNLNLTDLLFKYGVRINTDLVMDLQCDFMPFGVGGSKDNPQYEFLHWNYYPLFESKGNHPITKNLGLVAGRFVNSIDTVKANDIQKTVLLSSSPNSRRLGTPALISLNENRNTPEDAAFKQKDIPVAVLLEGKFTSLYNNRISKEQIDTLNARNMPYTASGEGKLLVVADGDMVMNDFSQKDGPLPMGLNMFTLGTQYEYQFANREFLQNCLEYLTNNSGIIETRNKDIVLRLLDGKKVEKEKTTWQLINIALPVLLVFLFGFVYQQVRKKRYAA
jgi:ABC-2 type transport system permease protein